MTSSAAPHEAPLRTLISIKGEPLVADPDMCRFAIDRPVHPGGPFFYKSREAAAGSPLPERLFEIDGVTSVLVAGPVVTVGEGGWAVVVRDHEAHRPGDPHPAALRCPGNTRE